MEFPKRYAIGPKNKQLNNCTCIRQVSQGIILGIIAYWFVEQSLGGSVEINGKNSNLRIQGVVLFSGVVILASLKLIIATLHWTIPLLTSFILSIVVYIGYIWLMDIFLIPRPAQGSVLPSFTIPEAYLIILFLIFLLIAINNRPKFTCQE